jgi:SPP1 gp7 family putative phage head morphogenesis protein
MTADALEKKAETALAKAHLAALNEIRLELAKFFEKYADKDGKITYGDAAKYDRLAKLNEQIGETIIRLERDVKKIGKQYAKKAYEGGYFDSAYKLEMDAARDLDYKKPDNKKILALTVALVGGATVLGRIKRNTYNTVFSARAAVQGALATDKGIGYISKNIKDLLGKSAYEAQRIARTEMHRMRVEGQLSSMEHAQEAGVKLKKRWVASMDERTRKTHQELDGQEVGINEEFEWIAEDGTKVSAPAPGLSGNAGEDILCRCAVIEVIEGLEPKLRSDARGNKIPYVTRAEWNKRHGF